MPRIRFNPPFLYPGLNSVYISQACYAHAEKWHENTITGAYNAMHDTYPVKMTDITVDGERSSLSYFKLYYYDLLLVVVYITHQKGELI